MSLTSSGDYRTPTDRSVARDLARRAVARGDPTGWFEELYRLAEVRPDVLPWSDKRVNTRLVSWAEKNAIVGGGRRALVVGCGYGDDAEWLSSRGFRVLAFDISATAISAARAGVSRTRRSSTGRLTSSGSRVSGFVRSTLYSRPTRSRCCLQNPGPKPPETSHLRLEAPCSWSPEDAMSQTTQVRCRGRSHDGTS